MNTKLCAILFFITLFYSSKSSKAQVAVENVQTFIKKIGIDSISKVDLLNEKYFQFNQEGIKITHAEIYFHSGESFKNLQMQTTAGNYLGFVRLYSIINAKTPFKITVASIRYLNKNGVKGFSKDFSLVVY